MKISLQKLKSNNHQTKLSVLLLNASSTYSQYKLWRQCFAVSITEAPSCFTLCNISFFKMCFASFIALKSQMQSWNSMVLFLQLFCSCFSFWILCFYCFFRPLQRWLSLRQILGFARVFKQPTPRNLSFVMYLVLFSYASVSCFILFDLY